MDLILRVAQSDERIRAVVLAGSRANPAVPKDQYQDYDVAYFVADVRPFYGNPAWVVERFGEPLIMQMPEAMRQPRGGARFNYQMIFPDGNRVDLDFETEIANYIGPDEPAVVLLDKDNGDGIVPPLPSPADTAYHIKPPSALDYYSCCNDFWWCLNNVAKGIARDELPYMMSMLNEVVRSELHDMMAWHVGIRHGFDLSVGKNGKYFKRYLPSALYAQYVDTYSGAEREAVWASVFIMCDLFHTLATDVATHFGHTYRQAEEDGIRKYLRMVREDAL